MKPTDGHSPTVENHLVAEALPHPIMADPSVKIERQSEIDEHKRSPTTPKGVSWVMCALVSLCGCYALFQIGRPTNSWADTLVFGAIVLASLTIAGGVLTPFDLRFDRMLSAFKQK